MLLLSAEERKVKKVKAHHEKSMVRIFEREHKLLVVHLHSALLSPFNLFLSFNEKLN
jgi:hypothetical protein